MLRIAKRPAWLGALLLALLAGCTESSVSPRASTKGTNPTARSTGAGESRPAKTTTPVGKPKPPDADPG